MGRFSVLPLTADAPFINKTRKFLKKGQEYICFTYQPKDEQFPWIISYAVVFNYYNFHSFSLLRNGCLTRVIHVPDAGLYYW